MSGCIDDVPDIAELLKNNLIATLRLRKLRRRTRSCSIAIPWEDIGVNLEKYRHQHSDILKSIQALRELSRSGIAEQATEIAQCVISMSSVIKLHLSVEDRYLYPELQKSGNRRLASMGTQYQQEMQKIASAYIGFAARWNEASKLARDPEGFRREANQVLKILFERIRKENRDFYPAIEQS